MKKQLKLLVENLFDDLYNIDQETNSDIDLADNEYIRNLQDKFNKEYNKTIYSDFSTGQILQLEPYLELAEDIFNFVKKHERGNEKYYVYKVELYNESYKISIIYDTGTVAINMYNFYMLDENHIELIEYFGSKFIQLYGKSLMLNIMDILCLINKKQIIVQNIHYMLVGHQFNVKSIDFGKYSYVKDVQIITNFVINNFPNIFVMVNNTEKRNVFDIKGLRVSINGLIFDSEDVCKNFYELLKSKNIKKYDCISYGYIKLKDDENDYSTSCNLINIQTEFCITNKFEQYSLTSDTKRIEDLITDDISYYCKQNYDYLGYNAMYSFEKYDKGKDNYGSYARYSIDFEFYNKDDKYISLNFIYRFYKSGKIIIDDIKNYINYFKK